MFTIEMLPADEGDALWLEYGPDDGPIHRVLIDCGRRTAYREVVKRLSRQPNLKFDLFVLTHVDADHITGAIPLLQDGRFGSDRVGDVWFNGWRHLNGLHRDPQEGEMEPPVLGSRQGEYFGAVLRDRQYPWNTLFDGHTVVVQPEGDLPRVELGGGMVLTLLSPTWDKLDAMRERWVRDLAHRDPAKRIEPGDWQQALELLGTDRRHGPDVLGREGRTGLIVIEELSEAPFDPDDSEPNGSSISFLAEFDGKAVLFAADAHAPQLANSVRRLNAARGVERLRLDGLKMAHHGSMKNNSYELLELLDCKRYLLSSNGARHHHPDPETLARVLTLNTEDVEFVFNYESEETLPWANKGLQKRYSYTAVYPKDKMGVYIPL